MAVMTVSCSLWFAVQAGARVLNPPPDRYQGIPQRNIFGLKAPEQAPPAPAQPPRVPKVTITGITTILGDKRALLKAQPPAPARPGESGKEESMILAEGQREGPIEVLNIDEKSGTVKLDNSGTLMTLSIDKDGPKPPTSPAGAGAPTQPAPGAFGVPLTNQVQPPSALPKPGTPTFPSRLNRGRSGGVTAPVEDNPLPPTGGAPVPPGSVAPAPQPMSIPNLTPEEQAIIDQLQQQQTQQPTAAVPSRPGGSSSVTVPPSAKPPDTVPPGTTAPGPNRLLPQ